jgi:transcriptional regulator with XRE-family HTH domain
MGKAGQALKQALETYRISQNQLAVAMGIRRSNISRWVSEVRDPTAETMLEIRDGLQKINPAAAEEFIKLYLEQPHGSTAADQNRYEDG